MKYISINIRRKLLKGYHSEIPGKWSVVPPNKETQVLIKI